MSVLRPVVDAPDTVFVGAGIALAVAVVLSWYDPAFDSSPLWTVGLTTVGFVLSFEIVRWAIGVGGPVPEAAVVLPAIGLATALYVAGRIGRRDRPIDDRTNRPDR